MTDDDDKPAAAGVILSDDGIEEQLYDGVTAALPRLFDELAAANSQADRSRIMASVFFNAGHLLAGADPAALLEICRDLRDEYSPERKYRAAKKPRRRR